MHSACHTCSWASFYVCVVVCFFNRDSQSKPYGCTPRPTPCRGYNSTTDEIVTHRHISVLRCDSTMPRLLPRSARSLLPGLKLCCWEPPPKKGERGGSVLVPPLLEGVPGCWRCCSCWAYCWRRSIVAAAWWWSAYTYLVVWFGVGGVWGEGGAARDSIPSTQSRRVGRQYAPWPLRPPWLAPTASLLRPAWRSCALCVEW